MTSLRLTCLVIFLVQFLRKTTTLPPTVSKLVDSETTFSDVTFTPELVFRVLGKLKSKPTAGPNGYSSVLLKALAGSINCLPLAIICAFSFETGTLRIVRYREYRGRNDMFMSAVIFIMWM